MSSAAFCKHFQEVIVAPRGDQSDDQLRATIEAHQLNNITVLDSSSAFLDISSTNVRSEVARAHALLTSTYVSGTPEIAHLVTPGTAEYIGHHFFFKREYYAEHHQAARTLQRGFRGYLERKVKETVVPEEPGPSVC